MDQTVEEIHARQDIGRDAQRQEGCVHQHDQTHSPAQIRGKLIGMSLSLKQVHALFILDEQRHHHDEAQTAAILHKAPVKQKYR